MHPEEVWEWVLRDRIFMYVLVRGIGVSMNFLEFCIYGSSEWASVMILP